MIPVNKWLECPATEIDVRQLVKACSRESIGWSLCQLRQVQYSIYEVIVYSDQLMVTKNFEWFTALSTTPLNMPQLALA
jgi:hypothetical protein